MGRRHVRGRIRTVLGGVDKVGRGLRSGLGVLLLLLVVLVLVLVLVLLSMGLILRGRAVMGGREGRGVGGFVKDDGRGRSTVRIRRRSGGRAV